MECVFFKFCIFNVAVFTELHYNLFIFIINCIYFIINKIYLFNFFSYNINNFNEKCTYFSRLLNV